MNHVHLLNSMVFLLFQILISIHVTRAGEGLTAYSFLFGMGGLEDVHHIPHFKPDEGQRLRKKYEEKHGPRGRYLIEKLGQGYSDEGPSVLDPDQTTTKLSKKKSKRNKTKTRSISIVETTAAPSTTNYDTTTNTIFYDSTTETTYDTTTSASVTSYSNDDYDYK